MTSNKIIKNNVINRFLPVPESVLKGLEPEPKITDFEFIKELGVGSFGRVYLVSHKKTKAKYAIKAIDKKNKTNIEEKPYFRREIEIMYRIHHPNVVKLFGHFEDNNYCYFIMEYITKGNIYNLIPKDSKKRITAQVVASLMKDVISAVYFLHKMRPPIIHRDIKPENVLLAEGLVAKLTDFGWSNYIHGDSKRTTVCGTPIYLAPEIINERGHNEKVDIWCIGVLLFELVTGNVPFQGRTIEELKANIRRMKISWPRDINMDAEDLISRILKYNPEDRLPLEEILLHPFFTKFFPNAIDSLIKPGNTQYKVFVVSKDDPRTWDPVLRNGNNISNNYNNMSNNYNNISNNYYPRTKEISPHYKNEKSNYDKEKYNSLLHKYEELKKEYYNLRTAGYSFNELENLKKELKEKENRINELARSEVGVRRNPKVHDLENTYDDLTSENYVLKDRIRHYEKYLDEQDDYRMDHDVDEIRSSINCNNKVGFGHAVERLRTNLDDVTKRNFNAIIKLKDREIERYREEEKSRRDREKKKFSAIINKYDKTLSLEEQENQKLRKRLEELQNHFH